MRTEVRTQAVPAHLLVALGVVSLAGALATWRGTPLAVVVPLAAIALAAVAVSVTRRALRRAATMIDTILREELRRDDRELAEILPLPAPAGSAVEERVELERRQGVVDDHCGAADDACPIPRAGLDDAQLRRGQRQ
jgi:hypothetical protein